MARAHWTERLTLVRLTRRMPAWVRIALSILSIVLGAVIVLRPTTALDLLALLVGGGMVLTGILDATGRVDEGERRWRGALAVGWIVLGVFVLAWPGLTVRAIAVITGLLLLAAGAAGIGGAFAKDRGWDSRIADAAFGGTGIIFGILALVWPDITLLVVAVVFGAMLIMRGISDLWLALRHRRDARRDAQALPDPRPPRRRWGRAAVAVLSVVAATAFAVVTAPLHEASTVVDEFYAAPRSIPDRPGQLIRAEPFTREVPQDAEAWRILYTTTGMDGRIRVASGLVAVPTPSKKRGSGPWPVIDWNHSTTGFAQHCAPSLQERPFWSGGLYPVRKVLAQGWAIVAPDYVGLGTDGVHPYLFGEASAMASLDAVRAARQLDEADLSPATVVWGHSQGGGAALWTGGFARQYAPDVWIRGVAAFAPASDPPALVDHVSEVTGGLIFASYAFAAYSEIYPGITYERYIRPGLQPVLRAMSERCLTDPTMALSVAAVLGTSLDPDLFSTDPAYGELGQRLRESMAPTEIGPPVFLGQGQSDSIVLPAMQDAYVDRLCAPAEPGLRPQRVDYRRYAGYEHAQVMETYSPMVADAIAWTHARFAGEYTAGAPACTTTDVAWNR
ncbi:MAG: DUF308 domain-containing protein [Microbacterium sp.]|uniref:lipase family protein n=1 Tax=Microbacterium sp. TaxID=51671 RepID=UPI001AC069A4|nr:lipase family protein [Microbacterium sp.]MBN9177572.1 DUF308 domain-containing protein [Microbacterium sp.]